METTVEYIQGDCKKVDSISYVYIFLTRHGM